MQVPGAQFRPGPFPSPSGGPDTLQVTPKFASTIVGRDTEQVTATLGVDATSAIIGVDGFDGVWILPAEFPSDDQPNNPRSTPRIELAEDFPAGPFDVLVAGGDSSGRIGKAERATIIALDSPAPTGTLVVALEWDGRADLELHVVDPLGGEAWAGNPNTHLRPPPGQTEPPDAYLDGGILDHDGNGDCRRDGHPNEHIVWTMPPPPGSYVVRVDAFSMCGDADAAWEVSAFDADGSLLGANRGLSVPDDVSLFPHGAGAGITALTFSR